MKMKLTHYVLVLFWGIVSTPLYAQNYTERAAFRNVNSHWFIRGSSDVMFDMRTSPPTEVILPGTAGSWVGESGSGVSDTATGDLLFYSNGYRIYNRNHRVMLNGDSIAPFGGSTMQNLAIVPVIDTPNKYYVFALTPEELPVGLFYSVVDMDLDGGLGGVEPGRKGVMLYDGPLSEAMVAIPGDNCDVWVLVHPYHDSVFLAYHITANGLDTVPVVSSAGTSALNYEQFPFEYGGMSVSPQRDRIAVSSFSNKQCNMNDFGDTVWGGLMLAKFDAQTGKVSEGIKVDHHVVTYAHSFSPNGQFLYTIGHLLDSVTGGLRQRGGNGVGGVVQYDVSSYSQATIMASKYIVDDSYAATFMGPFYGMRKFGDTIITTAGNPSYHYIASPDLPGALCNWQKSNYFGSAPHRGGINLGTDAIYPLSKAAVGHTRDTSICSNPDFQFPIFAPQGYDNYKWNIGSSDSFITISQAGTYWVEYGEGCDKGIDTFHIDFVNIPKAIITVNEKDLSTSYEYDTYQWMYEGEIISGETDRIYTVTKNGDYQVIVSLGGCIDTSAPYRVNNATNLFDLNHEADVWVYPNPASTIVNVEASFPVEVMVIGIEGKVYKKVDDARQIAIHDLAAGLYLLEIKDKEGRTIKVEKLVKSNNP